MTSFLGVPMHIGDKPLGTDLPWRIRMDQPEFTEDDEKVIETLAAYASVAISNARLYQEINNRDISLTRRNADLALLNDLASTLTSSLDVDEILEKALNRVMGNQQITVGEVFIADEAGKTLTLMHHLGNYDGSLWVKDKFEFGEGPVGDTALLGASAIQPNSGEVWQVPQTVSKDSLHEPDRLLPAYKPERIGRRSVHCHLPG